MTFETTDVLYENALSEPNDIADWTLEGNAATSFPRDRLRLENVETYETAPDEQPHYTFWCPETFPDDIEVSWDFWPVREPGLCVFFFAARGDGDTDVFDPALDERTGIYTQYHSGDIDALHLSYFRRTARYGGETLDHEFQLATLRKSRGFDLVAQAGDPLPNARDANGPYRLSVTKSGPDVVVAIDDLTLFHWVDDGDSYGPVLAGGNIAFRQMAPLIAEYANRTVRRVERT